MEVAVKASQEPFSVSCLSSESEIRLDDEKFHPRRAAVDDGGIPLPNNCLRVMRCDLNFSNSGCSSEQRRSQ